MLGGLWYIAGGGNNTRGCTDVVALDVRALMAADARGANGASSDAAEAPAALHWLPVCDCPPRSPLACEGLSLQALPWAGVLTAFGGYNGKYHNSLHVFRPGELRPNTVRLLCVRSAQPGVNCLLTGAQSASFLLAACLACLA